MQTGPNTYVRTGPMPGSVQAGAVQIIKDVGDGLYEQGVSSEVSEVYEKITVDKKRQDIVK